MLSQALGRNHPPSHTIRRPHRPSHGNKQWPLVVCRTLPSALAIVTLLLIGLRTARMAKVQHEALDGGLPSTRSAASSFLDTSAAPVKKIAYVISVTSDGPYMDGAAVLAYGINKAMQQSAYPHDLIAVVHPNVTTSRAPLQKSGWRLVEREVPVKVSDIRGELRTKITNSGCCGESELLKLEAWTLTDYHRVVHLDMDSMVLQPLDELYKMDKDLLYTCDVNMMSDSSTQCPVQGGFFVLRPDRQLYKELVDTVLEGDFRDGSGWGGKGVGWFYGGQTIQGLLPYFFLVVKDPLRSRELNRCVYNTMYDTDVCRNVTLSHVKSAHFTVCQKPWTCHLHHTNVVCNTALDKWHELRKELEESITGTVNVSCDKHLKYHPMNFLNDPVPVAATQRKLARRKLARLKAF